MPILYARLPGKPQTNLGQGVMEQLTIDTEDTAHTTYYTLLQAAWAVFRKDLRAELRTRYALNAVALFAVSTVVALSLGVGFLTEGRNADLPAIHSALLWVAVLF